MNPDFLIWIAKQGAAMRDIVERLRECATPLNADMYADEMLSAAAEIDRLREQIASLQASSGYEASIAQVEIKRLRAVVIRAKDALLDGQSTQWVHDLLVAALEPKP